MNVNGTDENQFTNISWTSKIENNVREIGEKSKGYKIMHMKSSVKISKKYNLLMYSGIIMGPLAGLITGIGAILNPSECSAPPVEFLISTICIAFFSGIVVSISKFGKYEEKRSLHKLAASKYTSLESNVRRQLVLAREDRINAGKYIEYVGSSFDELFSSSPHIYDHIYRNYVKLAMKHGMVVPDEYGLTIKVEYEYQKTKELELKNLTKIGITTIHEEIPLEIDSSKIGVTDTSISEESIHDEISLENNKLTQIHIVPTEITEKNTKGTRHVKRSSQFTDFADLNKFSDGRMEYEIERMIGIK
jgi:hypothetical protein